MRNLVIIFFILLLTNNINAQSIFDSNFHQVNFISDDIQNTKINKINYIKKQSLLNIFDSILLKSDLDTLKRNLELEIGHIQTLPFN